MKRPVRIVLAIFLIIFLYIIWTGLGSVLFGWRHGGGAIPIMLFIAMAVFVWKKIAGKKDEDKSENSLDSQDKEQQ
jgi:ABC-type dipeptide/oligopeptide/nickel transport system permease subunit